jgi:glycogen(starch) synthase
MGGYEVVWQGATRRTRGRGHEVRILTGDHRVPDVEGEEEPDVHRELEMYWSWSEHEWRQLGPLDRLRLERRNGAALARHLAEFRPDIVAFWSMGAMSLSLVERVRRTVLPAALIVHDDWLVYGPRRDAWMRLWSGRRRILAPLAQAVTRVPTRFSRERAERVLANSNFTLRRAQEHGFRLPDADVVTPGIDERLLHPVPNGPWGWRLLCVGRMDRHKGTDTAIAALSELPEEATLVLAGSGDRGFEKELRAECVRLGLEQRVTFVGQVDRHRLPDLYASADAVVFPVRWEEPFGLVPLEAMGRGRPVVATARGGTVEYLRHRENALVFEHDDPRALAECVRRLSSDPSLRTRLRERGLATAAKHTAARFEDRIVDELERIGGAESR